MLSAPRVWSVAKKQQRDESVTKGDTVGRLGPEPFLEMQADHLTLHRICPHLSPALCTFSSERQKESGV